MLMAIVIILLLSILDDAIANIPSNLSRVHAKISPTLHSLAILGNRPEIPGSFISDFCKGSAKFVVQIKVNY